jgi:hypothetical protein
MSGCRPTNSCASARIRLVSSPPQRRSIRTLRPSVQPKSASACVNAEMRSFATGSFSSSPMSTPIRRMRSGCWARAVSGHVAALPSPTMNSIDSLSQSGLHVWTRRPIFFAARWQIMARAGNHPRCPAGPVVGAKQPRSRCARNGAFDPRRQRNSAMLAISYRPNPITVSIAGRRASRVETSPPGNFCRISNRPIHISAVF